MAVTNFIRTIWDARMLENLNKNLVYGNIVNRNYEGTIVAGGSVKIPYIGAITVGNFTGSVGTPEALSGDVITLTIDKKKFFAFAIEDIDKAQTNVNMMDSAMAEAGYAMAAAVDADIAALHTTVATANVLGTEEAEIEIDKTNAYDAIVDLGVKLDEANVPKAGRFVVIPSWFEACLIKSDYFAKNPQLAGQTVTNGLIGTINGMQVFVSNNVPVVEGATKVLAGYTGAITLAMQIQNVEAYRPEGGFQDAVKGLTVYGVKTVRPTGLALLNCKKKV